MVLVTTTLSKDLRRFTMLLGLLALMLQSCSKDPTESNLELSFKLNYDGNPLVAFEEFAYPLDFQIFFTKYSMFISDLTLLSDEGDYVLSNVEFIDLLTGVNDQAAAERGKSLFFSGVPTRTYDGLSFNIGVPPEVNATAPADYEADSPLSNSGEYWEGWSSYIFHKIEGKMDLDENEDLETGIALHIGSDQAFRSINIDIVIPIDQESEDFSVIFDLAEILKINNDFFDFRETPQVHHLGVLPRALPILDSTVDKATIEM